MSTCPYTRTCNQLRALFCKLDARPFHFLGLAVVAILGSAYISQYGFGLHPCHLCLLQRYPYMLAIALCAVGIWLNKNNKLTPLLLGVLALTFLVETGIASYHAGVEWGLVPGPAGCTIDMTKKPQTPAEVLAAIKGAPLVSCSQPAFVFLGLSMAGWNALLALGLTLITGCLLRCNIKKKAQHE